MKKNLLPVLAAAGDHKLCPSFTPLQPGVGWVFGVVVPGAVTSGGSGSQMVPLENPEPVTEETFRLAAPLHPSEVFRIASPCVEGRCKNFSQAGGGGGTCQLAKAKTQDRAITDDLPACRIRSHCVWWHQEGAAACRRCPLMVTVNEKILQEYRGSQTIDYDK